MLRRSVLLELPTASPLVDGHQLALRSILFLVHGLQRRVEMVHIRDVAEGRRVLILLRIGWARDAAVEVLIQLAEARSPGTARPQSRKVEDMIVAERGTALRELGFRRSATFALQGGDTGVEVRSAAATQ